MKIKKNNFENYLTNITKKLNLISKSKILILILILSIIFIIINSHNKSKENMDNKCCSMTIDKNHNDEKIGNLANKAKLSRHKLCCANPDLVNCDC